MKQFFFLLITILNIQTSQAQWDSIEYNLGEPIFDFAIIKDSFYFRTFDNNKIIEADRIIFQPETYLHNFKTNRGSKAYEDSVQLAIITRTLKGYGEQVLYDNAQDFIRICLFKHTDPTIFRIELFKDSVNVIFKVGDGEFEKKGNLKTNKIFTIKGKQQSKFAELFEALDFFNQTNKVTCSDTLVDWPNLFFIESKKGNRYNVVTIYPCNKTKEIDKLLKYLTKIIEIDNKFEPQDFLMENLPLTRVQIKAG